MLAFVFVGYCNLSGRYCFVTWTQSGTERPFIVMCLKKLVLLLEECQPHLPDPIPEGTTEEHLVQVVDSLFCHGFSNNLPSHVVRADLINLVPPVQKAVCLLDLAVDFDPRNPVAEFERLAVVLPSSWIAHCVHEFCRVEGHVAEPEGRLSFEKFGQLSLAEVRPDCMAYPDLAQLDTIGLDCTIALSLQTGTAVTIEEYHDQGGGNRRRRNMLIQKQLHRVPVMEDFLKRHHEHTYSIVNCIYTLLNDHLQDGSRPIKVPNRDGYLGLFYLSNCQMLGVPETNGSRWNTDMYTDTDLKNWYRSPSTLHQWIRDLKVVSDATKIPT